MAGAAEVFAYYGGPSGAIPAKDVSTALRACGVSPSEDEVSSLVGGKATVSKAEFDDMLGKCPKDIPAATVADLFSVFDKSGNGTISINELKAHLSDAMATGQLTEVELKQMTKGFVTKGQLNYKDFVQSL
mmetsp:Transcript_104801/g.146091  ORF Transcript_104801/g.146091 Transcript_104801/m.146091 type:complete len:131 (-) Transcript_104801:127-519(-)